jgi:hypothetical protein
MLRHQLMFGPAVLVAEGVMANAFDSYLSKSPPPAHPTFYASASSTHTSAISPCVSRRPRDMLQRPRTATALLQAAVNVHRELHVLTPIKSKAIPFDN